MTPHGSVALAGSAIASPSATSVAVSPDGHFAYTPTRTFGATQGVGIVRYSIGDGGALTSVGSSPLPNDYYGIAVTPDGRFLYASGLNGIDRYAIALDGSLTGPTAVPSSIPAHKLAVSPDGRLLFAGGYFGQGVASYAIASDGALTENGGRAPTDTASVEYIAVAPDGRHIYLSAPNHGGIVTAAVAEDGDLTELATTPTGGSPRGGRGLAGRALSLLHRRLLPGHPGRGVHRRRRNPHGAGRSLHSVEQRQHSDADRDPTPSHSGRESCRAARGERQGGELRRERVAACRALRLELRRRNHARRRRSEPGPPLSAPRAPTRSGSP